MGPFFLMCAFGSLLLVQYVCNTFLVLLLELSFMRLLLVME